MKTKLFLTILAFSICLSAFFGTVFATEADGADAPTIISTGVQYHPTTEGRIEFTWKLDSEGTLTFTKGSSNALETASQNSLVYRAVEYWRAEISEGQEVKNEELVKTIVVEKGFDYIRNQHRESKVIFGGWPNLEKIIIPNNIYIVHNWTYDEGFFERNPKLTTISHSGTSENNRDGVINLEKVTRIDGKSGDMPGYYRMFYKCPSIKEVILPAKNTSTNVAIKTNQMFYGCTSLEKVNIPTWMTSLNKQMFFDCVSLEELTLPATVTSIAADALDGCTGLKSITILSTALNISALKIPDNEGLIINCATREQRDAVNAMGLTNVTAKYEVPMQNLMSDGSGYQYSYDEGIFTVEKAPTTASTVLKTDLALDFIANVKEIIITEDTGITEISAKMFEGWGASAVAVPSTLKTVGTKTFAGMENLARVVDYTAYAADNTAGAGVINLLTATSVAMDAFSGSSVGQSVDVYIGKSTVFAGEVFDFFAEDTVKAFYAYPTSTVATYFRSNGFDFEFLTAEQTGDSTLLREAEAGGSDFKWSFDDESGKLTIMPKVGLTASNSTNFSLSKDTTVWKDWKATWTDAIESIYVMNFGGYQIYWQHHDSAFSNLPNLKHVHIGRSAYRITRNKWGVNGMFEGCTSLTTVSSGSDDTYDETVDLSGWYLADWTMEKTFYNCKSIKNVILPDSLEPMKETDPAIGISEQMFYNCSALKEITIPDCFLSIGKNAFYGCGDLATVKILNSSINVSAVTANTFPKSTKIHVFGESALEALLALGLDAVDLTNPITAMGFSIRYEGYNGLRSIFSFDEKKNDIYEENGYTLKEYGVVAANARDYKYWGGITLKNRLGEYVTEATAIKKMPVYKDGAIVGNVLSSTSRGEKVDFAGTVVNFTSNHTSDLYIGAYTVYLDEKGVEYIHQVCYFDKDGNNVFNLYDITLAILRNHEISGILSANIDEKAIWNTVLQGADTEVRELEIAKDSGITLTLVKESRNSSTYVPFVRSEKGGIVTEDIMAEASGLIPDSYDVIKEEILSLDIADMGTVAPEFKESTVYSPTVTTPNRYTEYKTNTGSEIYGAAHPQGMAMDDRGNIYISFTGLIVKMNQQGEEIGVYKPSDDLDALTPHMGNICWHDGKLYISIEFSRYKLSNKRYLGVLDESVFDNGYVKDSDEDPLLHGVNIAELSEDNKFTSADGKSVSYFGGRGIDGITVGKLPGGGYILPAGYTLKEDIINADGTVYKAGTVIESDTTINDNKDYLVAVRSSSGYDTYRYDDDNQQIMVFDFDDITEENLLPLTYERAVNAEPTSIDIKFNMYVYSGYHTNGIQVISCDKSTGDFLLWTYGRAEKNNEFPSMNFMVIDGSKKLYMSEVEIGQSVPEDSEHYALAMDYASNYHDFKDIDGDGDTNEPLIGWHATLKCTCAKGDIELHEAKCYGDTGHPAKICGVNSSLKGSYGFVSLGSDFFYAVVADNGTAYREDGTTKQTSYGAKVKIYSLSRYHGAWKFTNVTSW